MQAQHGTGGLAARLRLDAGGACLNLLATVGWRGVAGVERVATPAGLATWLVDAGLLDAKPPAGEQDLEQVRRLREAIYAVVQAARHSLTPAAGAVSVVNTAAAYPAPQPRLDAGGRTAARHSDHPIQAAMAVLARDAIDLVTGPDLVRVRECDAADCRMLFLDTSRGARRRWCSMARCGNRAKARAHAARARRPAR
jgi:predicted RNA-binding Zn ribbon-like protein